MFVKSAAVLALALATSVNAAPVKPDTHSAAVQVSSAGSSLTKQQWTGDGSNWPRKSEWVDFQTMFDSNAGTMHKSCGWNGYGADNSDQEISSIYASILQAADATNVDSRFILAVVMQETKGCVRAPTTNNGVRNPGLMQSHNGAHSCNDGGNVQNPCPWDEISGMIMDGTAGTTGGSNGHGGDGLADLIRKAAGGSQSSTNDGQKYYQAARLYNSGSANWEDLNAAMGATANYPNDIANRLMGWTDV